MLDSLFAVAMGGALGASLRYGVSLLLRPEAGGFPWHTFSVNVAGSFLLGLLMALLPAGERGEAWRLFLCVGVLGGFTTFSTFSMETLVFARDGALPMAVGYAFASLSVALLAASAGYAIGRVA